MNTVLFLSYTLAQPSAVFADAAWSALLPPMPGLYQTLMHRPAHTADPFLASGPAHAEPAEYVLQLYFDSLEALEQACDETSGLGAALSQLASRLGPVIAYSQQAMMLRRFAVPQPADPYANGAEAMTYLVSYADPQAPHEAWLHAYLRQHVPLMARLPGIREVEVYTGVEFLSALPLPRACAIQRNKVVFDDPAALQAALQSPLRAQMRADFLSLPDIGLAHTHLPKLTRKASACIPHARKES